MENTVETYGLINIYYGTTGGNSRQLAFEFGSDAKKYGFLPKVMSMGDFDPDEFMTAKFCAMFLSTYGVGGPTEDSERFYQWIEDFASKKQPLLKNLNYLLFGLGNSDFEYFAGMSKKVNAFLYELGAKEVSEFTITDAKIEAPIDKFQEWRKGLFENILAKHPDIFVKREMTLCEIHKLNSGFEIKRLEEAPKDWEEKGEATPNLRFEMKSYFQHPKVKVLEIR
jgi:NADPH-ferrihemoprotein reductase